MNHAAVHLDEWGDTVCEHGTALDVHCCGCHSGFLFDPEWCVCAESRVPLAAASATVGMILLLFGLAAYLANR